MTFKWSELLQKNPMMATYNGVTDAKIITEREYKQLPDKIKSTVSRNIGVSRTGLVRELDREDMEVQEPQEWPYCYIETESGFVKVNVIAAVAITYLSLEQRDEIRSQCPKGTRHGDEIVKLHVSKYNVSKHAIALISNCNDEELKVFHDLSELNDEKGELHTLKNGNWEAYETFLIEAYRPPSKGGNTKALHTHRMLIDDNWYSFYALGQKKFVFKTDTVSFGYIITKNGYRNVKKMTIITRDAKGKLVWRGNLGYKKQLRSQY